MRDTWTRPNLGVRHLLPAEHGWLHVNYGWIEAEEYPVPICDAKGGTCDITGAEYWRLRPRIEVDFSFYLPPDPTLHRRMMTADHLFRTKDGRFLFLGIIRMTPDKVLPPFWVPAGDKFNAAKWLVDSGQWRNMPADLKAIAHPYWAAKRKVAREKAAEKKAAREKEKAAKGEPKLDSPSAGEPAAVAPPEWILCSEREVCRADGNESDGYKHYLKRQQNAGRLRYKPAGAEARGRWKQHVQFIDPAEHSLKWEKIKLGRAKGMTDRGEG